MVVLVAIAAIAGATGTWFARWVAWTMGIVDPPNPHVPQHTRTVPRTGGLGIAIGAAIAGMLAGGLPAPVLGGTRWEGLLLGLGGFLGLGLWDDARPLRPGAKLIAQTTIAGIVVGTVRPGAAPAEVATSIVWLVAIVNAVNMTDVCDGLVGSLAAAALVAVAIVSPALAPIALVLAGATLGFLAFNRPPASIFLGDSGTHLLGFAIGFLWLLALHEAPSWNRAAAALLGVGIFAFELVFLIAVRSLRGVPIWRGSADHFSLRLQRAGLSQRQTVALSLVPAAACAVLAVWLARAPTPGAVTVAAAIVLALAAAGWALVRRSA
jgi:UDP-GlcNAc:undecaprenyl-phosphate/decaprenyl-phosphate GlcNAc-1-phosphate transferase